jgi:hypothetical protein
VGLTVEPTPGHYRVLRAGKPLRKANGMPFMLPFSPDTIRWRRAAIVELRKLGIDLSEPCRTTMSPDCSTPTMSSCGAHVPDSCLKTFVSRCDLRICP